MLRGKKILLGISGSIAAYKSTYLVRYLVKEGAEVKVVMTRAALDFVTPVSLATLSKNPVIMDFYSDREAGTWNNHVELGLWADLLLIAPATANTLANMAHGICDNVLLACYLSARCPVWVFPAMDLDMYANASTQANLKILSKMGVKVFEATEGELASGLSGKGRMQEPEEIRDEVVHLFNQKTYWSGKHVLITAGPTYEAIDPVRFIGNHSSGKMGYALANKAASEGAQVTLVSGPTAITELDPRVDLVSVVSASEMNNKVQALFPSVDVGIFAAAVADYTPRQVSDTKIKKNDNELSLDLVKTQDILGNCGKIKSEDQLLIGFALETNDEIKYATEKLKKKNLNAIILNSLKDEGAGFKGDNNKITIIDKNNNILEFGLKSKTEVANDILNFISKLKS